MNEKKFEGLNGSEIYIMGKKKKHLMDEEEICSVDLVERKKAIFIQS